MISKNDIFLLLSFTLLFSTFLTFLSISDGFVITVDFNGIKRHHVLTAEDIIYDTDVPLLRLQKSDSSYEYDSLLYLILGLTITLYYTSYHTSYHTYTTVSKLREFLSKNISVLYDVSIISSHITSPQRTIQLQNSKKIRVLLLSFLILFFSSIAFFEPTFNLSEAYAQVAPISASDSINTLTAIDDPSFVYTITNRTDSTKLVTPVGVTTVLINGTSYALVISQTSGGVTIINITDPTSPTTTATINDGEEDFTALTNPRDITTILIDDKPYAIVATNFDGVQIINITDPTDPTATSAVNSNGFTGASSITTVTINDKHYALVTAHLFSPSIVSIIDITDPTDPSVITTINDGGAYSLNTPRGIATILIDDDTFALVASQRDNAVQIINITDPTDPTATAFIDNTVANTQLNGPFGITTIVIDDTPYALVASQTSDSVQIINITDPTSPTATASISDEGALELNGATGITTMVIGDNIYALVASQADDGVQIIDITNPTTPVALSAISDVQGNDIALNDVVDITTILINDRTYALVPSPTDNGVQIIDIGITFQPYILDSTMLALTITVSDSLSITDALPGLDLNQIISSDSLSITDRFNAVIPSTRVTTDFPSITDNISSMISLSLSDSVDPILSITDPSSAYAITNGEDYSLGNANDITTISIGDNTYALVAAFSSSAVQIIDITNPTSPRPTAVIIDNDTLALDGATVITTVIIEGTPYALVASQTESGVQIINVTDPTSPTATTAIFNGVDYSLDNPNGISTALINDRTYALVTSTSGVQIIDITSPARPDPVYTITDGTDFPELGDVRGITTISVGTSTYALVTSENESGVQIIDITNPARPVTTANLIDNATLALDNPEGITTVTLGDNTFALVASGGNDGIQIINVTDPTMPNATAAIFDNATLALDGANAISAVTIRDRTYALVASGSDDGVQIIDITDPTYPAPIAAIFDGEDFTTLDGAFGITTMIIGNNVYALVASVTDSGVQIIDTGISLTPQVSDTISTSQPPIITSDSLSITDNAIEMDTLPIITSDSIDTFTLITNSSAVSAIFDNSTLELLGAYDVDTVTVGTNTYALVTSLDDNGVQITNITDPTMPDPIATLIDNDTLSLHFTSGITQVTIDGIHYALVASFFDGIQIINITNPARPVTTANLIDNATLALDNPEGITTVTLGDNTFALVASSSDNGVQIIDITNPAMPAPVSTLFDNSTLTLAGAIAITAVTINDKHYALVVANRDDGVQIIDITNPAMPAPIANITDGNTFPTLDGANGITTVTIDGTIYALVTSSNDNGVQIINITDPTTPVATANIVDNGTSTALRGAIGITTVTVGANTFALVASSVDDGVQIIDITNPASPTPVSHITNDGDNTALDGARTITTTIINGTIYALVAAETSGAVQIIDIGISLQPYVFDSTVLYSSITVSDSLSITDNTIEMDALPIITSDSVGDTVLSITNSSAVSAIFDNSTLELDGASGITAVTINDTPYALVASSDDDGVQIIDITNPAIPVATANILDNSTLALDGATDITTVTINDNTYALVASEVDDGVQIINITNPAIPTPIAAISDNSTLALDGVTDITTITINDNTYALVASFFDHGVQIIDITDPTTPVATAAIFDGRNGFDTLLAAYGITTVTINDKHYALATSQFDNGVQIINITDPTTPVATANIINNDTLALSSPREITTILIDDNTFALVASFGKGVQIIDITDPSTPVATAALFDGVDYPTLGGATAITTITISDNTYAIVAAQNDNGVQIIDVTNPASPTPVSAITDDGDNTALLSAVGVTTIVIDNKHYALVASQTDDGVQIIDIGITIQSQISDSVVLSPVIPQPPITTSDSIDTFAVTSTPSSVSNLTDGRGGFSVLDGPSRVTTVTLGDNTFALVTASDEDNGIQIIDITDPTTPVATHALFDGPDFPTLGGASGIATATIGSSIYALVASVDDAGIQIIDITNSTDPTRLATSPTSISNITNNEDGFDELAGVSSITTVKIGDGTYALALSSSDASVTIIDITDPTAPTESFAITDKTTFPALNNPVGIATISINDDTFALVTSSLRDLVQIINITTPTDPTSTFIITNTGDYSLDGASGITTVLINDTSYALVTSQVDDGVQIIDITDPANPDPIVAITNGAEYLLDRPSRITTVTVGTITYALVISINSDGIQIIDITNPASPAPVYDRIYGSSTETPATNSLDITATIIDGTAYAIATSFNDDSIQIIDVGLGLQPQISDSAVLSLVIPQPPITTSDSVGALIIITDPTPASSIIDNSTLTLDDSRNIATVTIDDTLYALVTSLANDGVQIIDISNPATPVVTAAITDNSTLALDGAIDITIVTINDDTFALVASLADNGVQIINITNPANPDLTASIVDNSTLALDGTIGITTKVINNDTFALVAARDDNGVQIINITDPTTPAPIAAITDNSTLALGGAFDITTVTINDKHYALTASRTDNGVQIINISNPTTPVVTAAIIDNSTLALAGARGITTISINENTYALVASGGDDGVQIIDITNPAGSGKK